MVLNFADLSVNQIYQIELSQDQSQLNLNKKMKFEVNLNLIKLFFRYSKLDLKNS